MAESAIKQWLNPPQNRRESSCQCDLCKAHAETRAIIERGDVEELRQTVRDLSECLCNNGEELGMANAYIDDLRKEIESMKAGK